MAKRQPKYVYFFGGKSADGDATQKELLGGKGANLAEMVRIGLPVPAGFTITTEVCDLYYRGGRKLPSGLKEQVEEHIKKLEKLAGKSLGDSADPLLVSVRSGAARSMPGMMETVLNLGLNNQSVEGLAVKTGNLRFAYDAYRRFIQMYSSVVLELSREVFEKEFTAVKSRLGVKTDPEVPAEELQALCQKYLQIVEQRTGRPFPQNPREQLWGGICAVFNSWMAEKAVTYRRVERIAGLKGTAVNIVQMVFGNKGDTSGTGVCFTRDPNSGENVFYGDLLMNAQGEDVVAGIRTPVKLSDLSDLMPRVYKQLCQVRAKLEKHYRDMQDIEFTIEEGTLYILQCRVGKRSPMATFRIAADMVKERLITREEAVRRISADDIERLFYPVIDPSFPRADLAKRRLTTGIGAVPGASSGKIVFTAEEAEAQAGRGEKVILVRRETSPDDVGGMHVAQGILTSTGGKTSHAAVVARGWGKSCIVGCDSARVDEHAKTLKVGERTLHEGELLTLDGSEGAVYEGAVPLVRPKQPKEYLTIMSWADQIRRLRVRTNADTPYDAKRAVEMGAEGIGLCRTEHMFFDTEERRLAIQEMIVAEDTDARRRALAKLLPMQRQDFIGIFEAMDGRPVTIRLLDPPLHEFVPHDDKRQAELAEKIGVSQERIARRVEQLHESNPMLGHRGCRLSISYPEILEMQVRAIIEAAVDCAKRKIKVQPEIMHPLVFDRKELAILTGRTREVADAVMKEAGLKIKYLVGTMIELPRAAILAGQIAEVAEFFSFGTNDLTQTALGLSRDDAGRFLPDYVDEKKAGVFAADPFQSLDQEGVGWLVRHAVTQGRSTKSNLKLGICGEHGGDPKSVVFCHQVGLDYVSCSPFRVPIARLAAAQAVLQERAAGKGQGKARGRAVSKRVTTSRPKRTTTSAAKRRAATRTRSARRKPSTNRSA